jgi:Protein of unknown function (DUF2393)
MSDLKQAGNSTDQNPSGLFAPRKPESGSGIPVAAWGVAGLVVVVIVAVLIFVGRGKSAGAGNTVQPLAAYAANLPLSQLAMSESTNLSGGKYTYIDGHIKNTGSQTVTGVAVQVLFHNEQQMPPQVETLPLALIRTHEPYVDTQLVSASPLKPGEEREFRLTFETIVGNWNYQMPEVHVIRVDLK